MSQVWEIELVHAQQSVLLAMADHSHDDGSHVYPGVPYLAWKTGYSERNIQRILRELEEAGLIVAEERLLGGKGCAVGYRLELGKGVKKSPYQSRGRQIVTPVGRKAKGDNLSAKGVGMSPLRTAKGDNRDGQRVTVSTAKGDIADTHGTEYPRVESWEPYLEPSTPSGVVPNAELGMRNAESTAHSNPPPTSDAKHCDQASSIRHSQFPIPHSDPSLYQWLKEICGIRTLVVPPMWKRDIDDTVRALIEMGVSEDEKARFAANWPRCFRGRNGENPTPREVWAHWSSVVNYRAGGREVKSANEQRRDAILGRRANRHGVRP